jgi:hypothetical protein
MLRNIFYLCLDENHPLGGTKQIYRHVDLLNAHGFSAFVVHRTPGFRCTWFPNQTRVAHMDEIRMDVNSDCLVIPEVCTPLLKNIARDLKKVVFNQACYFTFQYNDLEKENLDTPYRDHGVLATLVVSEDSKQYLTYVFPELPLYRVRNGIDEKLFRYQPNKKLQIACMTKRNRVDLLQVINILKFRGSLKGYQLAMIEDKTEEEVARIMGDTLIFLAAGSQEGFSLPPAEAMLSGCIVVGYHGMGGREFFKSDFAYPVPQGEILTFAKTVEEVIRLKQAQPGDITAKGKQASEFIRTHYSLENEQTDVLHFWREMQQKHFSRSSDR